MQKNIQNDEDDKMKTTDSSKVVNEMIKELISEDELSDIESTNETHKEKLMKMLLVIGEQEEINPKTDIPEKGKPKKLKRKIKRQTRN
ncbi:MAG: hypothetical protein ACLUE7_04095 [Lachnospirales bacterium]